MKLICALFVFFVSGVTLASDEPRELVHLLDYLGQDYGGAIRDGKILSRSEYQEQLEFSETAQKLIHIIPALQSNIEISNQLNELHRLIVEKADANQVIQLSQKIKGQVITQTGLEVAPNHWPSLSHGQKLYSQVCTTCHGVHGQGDGVLAKSLNPKPINFFNPQKMDNLSPFKIYNAIRIGVPGTAMVAQTQLSDKDVWDLAFYVTALRHQDLLESDKSEVQKAFTQLSQKLTLEKVATLSDLEMKYYLSPSDFAKQLAILRTHSGDDDNHDSLQVARANIDVALSEYKEGHFEVAKSKALIAYLEGIEPVEPRLRASDPALTSELENRMALIRSEIEKRKSYESVKATAEKAFEELDRASLLLNQSAPSPVITFFIASAILLREGFEAVLIIIALLGVIRASGSSEAKKWVHGGWIAALLCGVGAWFLSGLLMSMSGMGRELMEGFTSIFAVVVLLYMGFWLHRTTEIGRWTKFINVKVHKALEGKKLFGLAIISFMAVFREAFETVLFLRALWLEGGMSTRWAMLGGVMGSLALILFLAWLILKYTARIPIRSLFGFSSTLMTLLSVILIGKGIHSLQEVGLLGITSAPFNIRMELLGFFPTLETTVAQLAILVCALALWFLGKKPSKILAQP